MKTTLNKTAPEINDIPLFGLGLLHVDVGSIIFNKMESIVGIKFGRLTVIGTPFKKHKYQHKYVKVLCDCGIVKECKLSHLKEGRIKSCGCYNKEITILKSLKHGLSYHPLYRVYRAMKNRCYRIKDDAYKNYGGRGITVCDEWKSSFQIFYAWCINNSWKKGLDIDRRNNDGNYCPDNCHFVSRKINNRNKRGSIKEEVVLEIRKLFKTGNYSQRGLGRMFGVSCSYVNHLINNRLRT